MTNIIKMAWSNIINNYVPSVITKVITVYNDIYNVTDYGYLGSGNNNYDYLSSCISWLHDYNYVLWLHNSTDYK